RMHPPPAWGRAPPRSSALSWVGPGDGPGSGTLPPASEGAGHRHRLEACGDEPGSLATDGHVGVQLGVDTATDHDDLSEHIEEEEHQEHQGEGLAVRRSSRLELEVEREDEREELEEQPGGDRSGEHGAEALP